MKTSSAEIRCTHFAVAKDPSSSHDIEDACAFDEELGLVAVIDGSSNGFDPVAWSRMLARAAVATAKPGPPELGPVIVGARAEWSGREAPNLPLGVKQQATGATLGIATFSRRDGTLWLDAEFIGDIGVLLYRNGSTFVPEDLAEGSAYTSRPATVNAEVKPSLTVRQLQRVAMEAGDVVLLYTDGIGKWLLERAGWTDVVEHLLTIDAPAFVSLVRSEQDARRMQIDDVTLARIEIL